MFNQTNKWDFRFIKSPDLEVVNKDNELLKVMQRIPISIREPWKEGLLDVLR
jgi:Txe/YoeB family toxin of Txe-Axe toxin-antitoxin module